uniref:autotransporter domain-containing protein n=1 Tax=Pontiella sp. TaxID=2837462 RepID=UPI003568CF19
AERIYVGNEAAGNSLSIVDGGQVASEQGVVGMYSGRGGNDALIDGTGSVWNVETSLIVGYSGSDNTMVIANGGRVNSDRGYVNSSSGISNLVLVTGTGSVWSNTSALYVGSGGAENRLVVESGGRVDSDDAYINGGMWSGDNNGVIVRGTQSLWKNLGDLVIGSDSEGNYLQVENGGTVENGDAVIGQYGDADGNYAVVSGSNAVWRNSGTLTLGHYGSDNLLLVTNGGAVSAVSATLGNGKYSSGNTALITGTNSSLSVQDELIVGSESDANTLRIENGATVESGRAYIGSAAGSDNNVAVVDDAVWQNNGDLTIGPLGNGNLLVVTNGGFVFNESTYVGTNSDDNHVLITGADSSLSNSANITVGYSSSANSTEILDGGKLYSQRGYIGMNASATGNTVRVSGAGSEWNADLDLNVGVLGSGNRLEILDGGLLTSGSGSIGDAAGGGSNNVAVVSGQGSRWAIRDGLEIDGAGNALFVDGWGAAIVGDLSTNDLPDIAMAGGFVVSGEGDSGEVVISNGARVDNTYGFIGMATNHSGRVLVTGENSMWSNRLELAIGELGSGNSLTVSDGGTVYSKAGFIGLGGTLPNLTDLSGGSNSVTVTGAGSEWNIEDELYVGLWNARNALVITNAGRVNAEYSYVGGSHDSSNNTAVVYGVGSVWSNQTEFGVGAYSSSNSLKILNGGNVFGSFGVVGLSETASHNSVLVSGADSAWITTGELNVGYAGLFNSLTVEDGASVQSATGRIGYFEDAANNAVAVLGAGSVWNNAGDLYVGAEGCSNTLTIADGGRVTNAYGYVGYHDADGNRASVSGADSVWQNEQLNVGFGGSSNSLAVNDGGRVESGRSALGYGVASVGNSALVSGSGSVWDSGERLDVGYYGSNNSLTIADGGALLTAQAGIGIASNASHNAVLVSGVDSVWRNGGNLNIGDCGALNRLIVEEGGAVESGMGVVGFESSSVNNLVSVSGAGSEWSSDGELHIGYGGTGNALYIYDGGLVSASNGYVGTMSDNNIASIQHNGSVWSNSANLYVGHQGSTNVLSVLDGGLVESKNAFIGYGSMASGNSVTVSGNLSKWNNSGELYVGYGGSDNKLTVENGGIMASGTGTIGALAGANGNWVSVAGDGSEWAVFGNLYMGGSMLSDNWTDGGVGNALSVSDGGLVTIDYDLHNRNDSSASIDPGSRIEVGGNYYQDATSALRLGVETNAAGAPVNALVSVGGTAEFEAGATIEYASNVGALKFDVFYTNKIVEADALIVAGEEDPDALDLEVLDASGTLVDVVFWEDDSDLYGLVGRVHLDESAGFSSGTMMDAVACEIDELSLLGSSPATHMIELLNGMSSEEQKEQLEQQYMRGIPTYQHARGMIEGMNEVKNRITQSSQWRTAAPQGAGGPYAAGRGVQAWAKPYGAWADASAADGFSGYDHSIYGTVVGLDLPVENALLGVAGGYVRSNLDQADGDSSQARGGYGMLYLGRGTVDWFGDFNMAFGRSKVELESGSAFGNTAEFDASTFSVYFGGGKAMAINRRLTVTPTASMLWNYYYQPSYIEESPDSLAREVDMFERNSLLASLGASLAWQQEFESATLKPELRLSWLHEFNSEAEEVGYTIVDGRGGRFHYEMPGAVSDVAQIGAGIGCRFDDQLELAFDIDGRVGKDYTAYAISGRIVFEF